MPLAINIDVLEAYMQQLCPGDLNELTTFIKYCILTTTIMAAIPSNGRKPRKDALYSVKEQKVLNKFKEEYRMLMTRELHGQMF